MQKVFTKIGFYLKELVPDRPGDVFPEDSQHTLKQYTCVVIIWEYHAVSFMIKKVTIFLNIVSGRNGT